MRSRGWPGWCRRCCIRIFFGFIILSEFDFFLYFSGWVGERGRGGEGGGGEVVD